MAKALVGHIANDHLLRAEITSLRAKVRQLEAQVSRLQAERALDLTDPSFGQFDSELAEMSNATPALT